VTRVSFRFVPSTSPSPAPPLLFSFTLSSSSLNKRSPDSLFSLLRRAAVVRSLTTQRNALQMLSNRTQIVLAYVRGVSERTMKQDSEIFSMISGLMAGLPGSRRRGSSREELLTVSSTRLFLLSSFVRSFVRSFVQSSPPLFAFRSLPSLPGVRRRPTIHLPRETHQIPPSHSTTRPTSPRFFTLLRLSETGWEGSRVRGGGGGGSGGGGGGRGGGGMGERTRMSGMMGGRFGKDH